ncbi:hypothetical protein G7Y89_g201 [Cudoniella acicularis]|uniref:Uncharacterized protein n=1 Tax=Cudoniella acicularis TaxID=354080 RepID=A0A8H4RYF7_9HELO|nr:hypothetical protein G7Y89_g201 [Cudoniella acicularis]
MEKGRKELQTQRRHVYKQRQKLISAELANYRRTQLRFYFDRVVRHIVPKRDRLSRTLTLSAPLRSEEGISALRDLIALRTNDSRVAYQEVLRPIEGRCLVPTCGKVIEDIKNVRGRWKHVYRCSKVYYEKHATACAGYYIGCLAKTWLPAAKRLQHYPERPSWQEHISEYIPDYIASLPSKDPIPYPHLLCPVVLHSEADLWHHFGDIHSTHKPNIGKKRRRQREDSENKRAEMDSKAPSGRKSAPKDRSKDPFDYKFMNMSTIDFNPSSADTLKIEGVDSSSLLCGSTSDDNVWDKHDDRQSTDTSLSSLSDDHLEAFPQTGGGCDSP